MATPLYHVYLSKLSTTPDNWDTANEADYDHANGWVKFDCSRIDDSVQNKNTHKHMASHVSYRLPVGKVIQNIVLDKVTIVHVGGSEDSDYYNEVKEFLLRHMMMGTNCAYALYLHVYGADPSASTTYIEWMDDSETMQSHCQINVKKFNFKLDNSGVFTGRLELEEVWDA